MESGINMDWEQQQEDALLDLYDELLAHVEISHPRTPADVFEALTGRRSAYVTDLDAADELEKATIEAVVQEIFEEDEGHRSVAGTSVEPSTDAEVSDVRVAEAKVRAPVDSTVNPPDASETCADRQDRVTIAMDFGTRSSGVYAVYSNDRVTFSRDSSGAPGVGHTKLAIREKPAADSHTSNAKSVLTSIAVLPYVLKYGGTQQISTPDGIRTIIVSSADTQHSTLSQQINMTQHNDDVPYRDAENVAMPASERVGRKRSSRGAKKLKIESRALKHVESLKNGTTKDDKKFVFPKGSWEDEIVRVSAVERAPDGSLLASVQWQCGNTTKHCTTVLHVRCPQRMLDFYTSYLYPEQAEYFLHDNEVAAMEADDEEDEWEMIDA